MILAAVATLALVLGLGAGRLLFGGGDAPPSMPAEHEEVWAQLENSENFDPGSVVYRGEKHGATVWQATTQDGTQQCLVIDAGGQRESQCLRSEQVDESFGLSTGLQLGQDGELVDLWAALVTDVDGRQRLIMQRHVITDGPDTGWESMYSQDELVHARILVAAGFDGPGLQLVGYDDASPVWFGFRDGQWCLAVVSGTAVHQSCDGSGPTADLNLTVGSTTYELRQTPNRGRMLTVVRGAPTEVCSPETGECATIDDTTGEYQ
ncbi:MULTISPECIES: hypothetical protein [Microbacterium]|uniref:hypothetical protein n=1 Tax=Microbacterium TaxID=33882 RepID=UPI00217E55D9|nr:MULTISPECIES: hypothetical protein [Microbacterium]UWF77919.1 hypothetical protein JSY13_02330 [Microbacterium neungamense]WCM56096.1 hypothetical protein JRG78_02375 [Microbacterium sp. EF45047]